MEATDRSVSGFPSREAVVFDRLEVIEGPTGRRSWPDDVKGRLVVGSYRAKTSVSAFARRNGIAPSQLFGWRRDAREGRLAIPADEADEVFASLVVEEPRPPASPSRNHGPLPSGWIELDAAGVVLRLPADMPAARIAEIARALA